MANLATVLYQKTGVNFKTTVFNIALSGANAAPEVVTLTAAASNPQARTVTGPQGAAKLPPRVSGGPAGYVASLVPTATAGQYDLTFAYGATAFAGNFAAGAFVTVEIDHDLQGY